MMILLTRTDLANFNAILADYGLAMAQGYIGDTARYYAQYGRFYFSATLSASSPITAQFGDDDLTLIYGAHGMTQCDPVHDTITVTPLHDHHGERLPDAGGQTGTYILGAQAEEETDGGTARLTVFTTESVVDQSILTFNPSMVNLDIFLNAATSGMEDISAISIPAKSLRSPITPFSTRACGAPLSGRHPPGGPDRRPGLLDQAEETVMNRQTKQLLALAGVLAVGLGAYAALRVWNAGRRSGRPPRPTMCSSSAMSPPSPLIPGTAPSPSPWRRRAGPGTGTASSR